MTRLTGRSERALWPWHYAVSHSPSAISLLFPLSLSSSLCSKKQDQVDSINEVKLTTGMFCYWGLALAGLPGIVFMQIYGCKPSRWIGVFALFFNLAMLVFAGGIMQVRCVWICCSFPDAYEDDG